MEDCIIISDDEDIQVIQHVVHLEREPIVIDLTNSHDLSLDPNEVRTAERDRMQASSPMKEQQINQTPPPNRTPSPSQTVPPDETPQCDRTSQPFQTSQPDQTPLHKPTHQPSQSSSPTQSQHPYQFLHPEQSLQSMQTQETAQTNPAMQEQTPNQEVQAKPKQKPMSDRELMMAQKALGNEKYKNNLIDDAIRTYRRANELAKKLGDEEMSAILHFNLAMSYYKLGSYDQAADECGNAVKINDKYIKAHLKRAEIYQRQFKFEEAVICYEHICELDSSNLDYKLLLKHAREAAKQTRKKDYYQLLGLNSFGITREDLKKAYRRQALSHHPDRHSDADIVTRRIEEKRFKEASEAHSHIQLQLGYRL